MTNRYCPYPECGELLTSEKKFNIHLALKHEAYDNAVPVQIQSIKSLDRVKHRVEYLLRKIPSTRGNDWQLFLLYNRYFNGLYVYNEATRTVQFRNPIGIPVAQFIHQTSYETIRRSRQLCQSRDSTLRPAERVQALRDAKEGAYHDYFAGKEGPAEQMAEAYYNK